MARLPVALEPVLAIGFARWYDPVRKSVVMADLTEELRQLVRQSKQDEAKEATQFERLSKRFYVAQNKTIISWGEENHRKNFGTPKDANTADFVVSNGPHSLIIAEAKGTDIDHALKQLKKLAVYVQEKYPLVELEFHLLLREGTDPNNLAPAINQAPRYKAKSTRETLLWKNKYVLVNGQGEPVTIAATPYARGRKVFVIIGPGADNAKPKS
jgi:hypothetical protein